MGTVLKLMKRTEEKLDTSQVLSVIERYAEALQLLDNYDHQTLKRPEGSTATCPCSTDNTYRGIQTGRKGNDDKRDNELHRLVQS